MHIKRMMQGDVVVLAMTGKFIGGIDHEQFTAEIKSLVADGHVDVVLDMEKVTFVDSTGLGSLVAGMSTLKKSAGRMAVCCVPDRVDIVLEMTKLKLVFDTYETSEQALASFPA
jgi:anti-sigma B factor antagonist